MPFQPNGPAGSTQAGRDDAILFGATKPDPGGLPLGTLEYLSFSRFFNTPGTPFQATLNLRSGSGTLAPGTVARAYRELEASGVIETRGRNGTFVSFSGDPARRAAQQAATAFAEQIRRLRIDPDEALALVRTALRGGGAESA